MMVARDVILDYVAGALSGSAGVLFGHPLDTIKCQLQVQQAENRYKGVWDCCTTIHKQGLSKGFFRGLSWPLFTYGVVNSVFFGTYASTLKALGTSNTPGTEPSLLHISLAAGLGGITQLSVAVPVEVMKVVLQSQIPRQSDSKLAINCDYYKGPNEGFLDIVRSKGIFGMYRGLVSQFYRDIPASVAYFVIFEYSSYYTHKHFPALNSQFINFMAGGMAGLLSWTLIMPFDVLKSRMQADVKGSMYRGLWNCAQHSIRQDGLSILFRGYSTVATRAFLVNSVTLLVYIELLKMFNAKS